MRFSDKVCVVTGGASGIGRATCRRLAEEGGRVAVVDVDEERGQETAAALVGAGGEAIFVGADVGVAAEVQLAVAVVLERWRRLDVLVNCAGRVTFKRVVDLVVEDWDAVLAANLRSVFLCCKHCLPHMDGGGAIVNVSSVHAHRTAAELGPYAASKGGVEALTRVLSQECEASGIRVNSVAPGAVNTPMLRADPGVGPGEASPERRIGSPDDVAAAIAFLASDEARFITGASLAVDGGRLTIL